MTRRDELMNSAGKLPTEITPPKRYILSFPEFMGMTNEGKPFWTEGRINGNRIDYWQTDGVHERRIFAMITAEERAALTQNKDN